MRKLKEKVNKKMDKLLDSYDDAYNDYMATVDAWFLLELNKFNNNILKLNYQNNSEEIKKTILENNLKLIESDKGELDDAQKIHFPDYTLYRDEEIVSVFSEYIKSKCVANEGI